MSDKNNNFNIGDLASTASAYSAESDERRENERKRKLLLFKLGAMGVLTAIIIIVGSIAWFTMSREVDGAGVQMNAAGNPYTIETRSQSGYYKTQYDSLHSEAAEWMISANHNFDNHSNSIETDEQEPALEPGDHGSLEFRVNPQNTDTLTVDCLFEIKAYVETESEDGEGNTVTTITETNSSALAGYLSAHILLFSGVDPESGKFTGLIDNNNESLKRMLENQTYRKGESTYTTIYWYWPEYLSDLTDSANTIYAPSEYETVLAYIARNKDGFFKDCNDSNAKVLTDLTSLYTTHSNSLYNHYNLKYDNADLDIGNNLSYVILSMQVK